MDTVHLQMARWLYEDVQDAASEFPEVDFNIPQTWDWSAKELKLFLVRLGGGVVIFKFDVDLMKY